MCDDCQRTDFQVDAEAIRQEAIRRGMPEDVDFRVEVVPNHDRAADLWYIFRGWGPVEEVTLTVSGDANAAWTCHAIAHELEHVRQMFRYARGRGRVMKWLYILAGGDRFYKFNLMEAQADHAADRGWRDLGYCLDPLPNEQGEHMNENETAVTRRDPDNPNRTTVEVVSYPDVTVEVRSNMLVALEIGNERVVLHNGTAGGVNEVDPVIAAITAPFIEPRSEPTIEVSPDGPQPVEDIESTVKGAVNLVLPLELDYVKANGERIRRTVSPAAVYDGAVPGTKIVFGFDHEREKPRQFRLDRIEGVCPAPVRFIDLETV